MSNVSEVRDIVNKLPEGAEEVDILVNNAGLALGTSPAQEIDLDVRVSAWARMCIGMKTVHNPQNRQLVFTHFSFMQDAERMLQTNVHGLITMTRQLLPGMVARNRGHIFNISSVAGHLAYAGGSIYCATKYAVRGFTDALRHDVCGTQVCPQLWPYTQNPATRGGADRMCTPLHCKGAVRALQTAICTILQSCRHYVAPTKLQPIVFYT